MALNLEQQHRYARHLILPEIGIAGQERLLAAKVLVVGTGGLGSPIALYLAAAGVGTIGIVDFDNLDTSNLQRQILYETPQVGRPKVELAAQRLRALNPDVRVVPIGERLTRHNALRLFEDYDYVVDGTDNFPTRYLINDACVLLGKIFVYGSIFSFDGQSTLFGAPEGPCYRCLFPVPPDPGEVPTGADVGVIGVLPGVVGLIQASETVKLITGIGRSLVGRLVLFDALSMRFREMKVKKDPACPLCGESRTIHELIDYERFCGHGELGEAASG